MLKNIHGQDVLLPRDSRLVLDTCEDLVFKTGHMILDEIVKLEFGSCALILDQNFSESKRFLSAMLNSSGWSNKQGTAELTTGKSTVEGTEALPLETQPLTYFSIAVNAFRDANPRYVLIHSYLPELLVSSPERESVLRALQSWKERITRAQTVELYLLPRDTFKDFERELRAIVDGVIEITPQTTDQPSTFTAIRGCRLEYENRPQEYIIEDGRLLVRCGNHFTERLESSVLQGVKDRHPLAASSISREVLNHEDDFWLYSNEIENTKKGRLQFSQRLNGLRSRRDLNQAEAVPL